MKTITPHYDKNKKRWFINYTLNKKRTREFFPTKQLLQKRIEEIKKIGFENILDKKQREEFLAASMLLKTSGVKIGLVEIVSRYLQSGFSKQQKQIRLSDAIAEYLNSKEKIGRRTRTIENLKSRLGMFAKSFPNALTSDLRHNDIEKYCSNPKWSSRTAHNVFTCLIGFLRFLDNRELLSFRLNFDKNSFLPKVLKKAKAVLDIDDAKKFFKEIERPEYSKFAAYFALAAFVGLRSAELSRLNWGNIDFANKQIKLPAEIVKTGEDFIIRDLPENLWAWLVKYKTDDWNVPTYAMRAKIGNCIGGLKPNIFRKTFTTMHVSLYGDTKRTSLILRHHSQERLWNNYAGCFVAKSIAEMYFNIVPASV